MAGAFVDCEGDEVGGHLFGWVRGALWGFLFCSEGRATYCWSFGRCWRFGLVVEGSIDFVVELVKWWMVEWVGWRMESKKRTRLYLTYVVFTEYCFHLQVGNEC